MLGRNSRTTRASLPPKTKANPKPSYIFTLCLDEAKIADFVLLDAQFQADIKRGAAEEEQEPADDLK
jgi:hypothetical protein